MEIIRHGGASHVVRPDRVYRTSVLQSMVGYSPGADVQAVAQAFTQGPPRATMLSGLGNPGPIQRFFLRVKAAIAERKARMFMIANGQGGDAAPSQPVDPQGPNQIAPQQQAQMSMVGAIASGRAPNEAMDLYASRRLYSYYRAY